MSGLEGLYQDLILDHSRRRHGEGREGKWNGEQTEHSPVCGDRLTLRVEVRDGCLAGIGWVGDGCSISMASASAFTELAEGMSTDDVRSRIDEFRLMLSSRGKHEPKDDLLGDAIAFAGVAKYPMRVKCALLAWVAAEAALTQAERDGD